MPGIIALNTTKLDPVEECIYCGSAKGRLTDEHIVPKGLGGTLVLPKSSCDQCAAETSQVELRVLRGFMDDGRQALGIKSRRSHKRRIATHIRQTIIKNSDISTAVEVPAAEAIRVMHLPVFTLPSFLNPDAPPVAPRCGMDIVAIETAKFGPGIQDVTRKESCQGVRFEDTLDIWAFVRMLAKIAHSYHVAMRGIFPLEESPLIPLILGKSQDAANWVGNAEHAPLPSKEGVGHLLEDASSLDDIDAVMVRVKLFASLGAPTYALATRIPRRQP